MLILSLNKNIIVIIIDTYMLDPIILKMLKNTNLGQKESLVYLAVLNLGSATVSDISRLTGLKRPNTYNVLEDLLARKYLAETTGSKVKRFVATDPSSLANQLETTARDFKEMLPYLQNIHRKTGKPIVTYYTGADGARMVFEQIKRPKEAYYSTSISKASICIPDEVERWRRAYQAGKARPGGYHLLSDTKIDRDYGRILKKVGQKVRYMSGEPELTMDFVLFDGKVVLTVFDEEISLTLIESTNLFESLKIIYKLAWKSARDK